MRGDCLVYFQIIAIKTVLSQDSHGTAVLGTSIGEVDGGASVGKRLTGALRTAIRKGPPTFY